MYSGYFIKNLLDVVCQTKISDDGNKCGKPYGDHSAVGNNCPSQSSSGLLYLDTTFSDDLESWYTLFGNPKIVQCQAAEGPDATQCVKGSVVGERFCREHLEELD